MSIEFLESSRQQYVGRISLKNLALGVLIKEKVRLSFMFLYFLANSAAIYWLSDYLIDRTINQVYTNPTIIFYFRLLVGSIPLIVGLFVGVPLLSSEYESGTYRYLFTQGAGRWRILRTIFGIYLLSILLFSVMTIVSINHFLSLQESVASSNSQINPPIRIWSFGVFLVRPIIIVPLIIVGFTAGVFLGAIIKRVIPGIAAMLIFGVVSALGIKAMFDSLLGSFVQQLYDSNVNGLRQHYDFNGNNDPKYLFLFQSTFAVLLILLAVILALSSLRAISTEGIRKKHNALNKERLYT